VHGLNRPNLTWLLIMAVAGLSLFVFACGGGASEAPEAAEPAGHHSPVQGEDLPTVVLPARWAWGDAEQLGTLTNSADVVFRGTVVALRAQTPVLQQGSGAAEGGPRWADFPVSRFEVAVESSVSGGLASGSSVILQQLGGVETRPDGTQVRLMLKGDQPIQVGQKYLFFGSYQGDETIEAPPFGRMRVEADGSLAAEAGWEHMGALEQLSRLHLGDAEREISVVASE
jgi:hypothetical protein